MRLLQYRAGRIRAARVSTGRLLHARAAATAAPAQAEDPFIAEVLSLASSPAPDAGAAVRASAMSALATSRMPTTRNELYRFTDLVPLLRQTLAAPPPRPAAASLDDALAACVLPSADASRVVIVDGVFDATLSSLGGLPAGVFVGRLADAPEDAAGLLGAQSAARGSVFAGLNSATFPEATVIAVSSRAAASAPIHVVYASSASSAADGAVCVSAPRVLVVVGEGASVEIVEEFVAATPGSGGYFVNAVMEAAVATGGELSHSYLALDDAGAFHMKATLVQQAAESAYKLVEARLGGTLSRHDVSVLQDGARTRTEMSHFMLSSAAQLHDLHTQLTLDHPEGVAAQLHKCIAAHATARSVFDGNVQVLKHAQQSDASQLSRNLLLVPKAMVNVKPNLQIIADDVKCTHGCAVSDLRPEELFYFQSRGIDAAAARKALVFSFGAEVIQKLQYKELVARLQAAVNYKLECETSAMETAA